MPYFLIFDASGNYKGSGDTSAEVPVGAIPCTPAEYSQGPYVAYQNGKIVTITVLPTPVPKVTVATPS